ncbi:MAG: hypothetical protein WD696_18810 [Bryobacteraceae bacterium]
MKSLLLVLSISLLASCSRQADSSERAALEEQFRKSLTGAALVGKFTSDSGRISDDRYVIEKVSKVQGDIWLFQSRIQYGGRDLPIPLPLTVKWAGDTPVITLTDMPIPGLGTFTARVMFFRDHYAGTWSGKDHGGQMFGKIVREGGGDAPAK